MVQNLSKRIFFQEKVEFLKLGIWFQFQAAPNKDTFFDCPVHCPYTRIRIISCDVKSIGTRCG